MGMVVRFTRRRHARASTTGRATSDGQAVSAGQLSENQQITSSYFRAVKVFASSSSRSKKRQSPAARRPIVAMLTDRADAYAEAHAMRFDRSSISMGSEDSRKIPTAQAVSIGNFPLAHRPIKSDKSAMPSADQIRAVINEALARHDTGAIAVVMEMRRLGLTGVDRTYLSDFLSGKKQSLSFDFSQIFATFLDVDLQSLRVSKSLPTTKIRKGARPHFYITEHMEARGWDDEVLAGRMDIPAEKVEAWRERPEKLQDWQISGFLIAFGMDEAAELARPPAVRRPAKAAVKSRKRA